MVLLIGNYPPDHQHSMDRFAAMMLDGLSAAGIEAELLRPRAYFGRVNLFGRFATKWLGYIDKFLLFPRELRRRMRAAPDIVHICDHSNAMYASLANAVPVVVTCHDLLAVRGALGEETDCPASPTGRLLQRWIVRGLKRASAVVCVSKATLVDAKRLVTGPRGKPKLSVIGLGLNYPYRVLSREEVTRRLEGLAAGLAPDKYVVHVGSNMRRKNREGVLRIFARMHREWEGSLVFAGDLMSQDLRSAAREIGILSRIVEVARPTGEQLEALYNGAIALIYPSRFEGFGWPIAEAQACGCPVVCTDAEPMNDIAGAAALKRRVDDEDGFAADLLRLTDPGQRAQWSSRSLENAGRFSPGEMISKYCELYHSIAGDVEQSN